MKLWAGLTPEERCGFARYYECFAACLEAADRELGRVIAWLEQNGARRGAALRIGSAARRAGPAPTL